MNIVCAASAGGVLGAWTHGSFLPVVFVALNSLPNGIHVFVCVSALHMKYHMRLPHRMLRVVVSFIEWNLVATANDIDVSFYRRHGHTCVSSYHHHQNVLFG